MRKLFLALILPLLPLSAQAFELKGVWEQGGYITGTVAAGSAVTVNGEPAIVGEDGFFLYGLGRHFPVEALVVVQNGQVRETAQVIVEPRTYQTQNIHGVAANKVNPNKEELNRIQAESRRILAARGHKTHLVEPRAKMALPVVAPLSSVYGSSRTFNGEERSWHKGVDLAAAEGTVVKSPAPGIVRLAEETFFSGNLVIVDHGFGLFGHYAHMKDIGVKQGQVVQAGTPLGHVGATGRVTGPHLHWGLYWQNVALDPMLWVQ